MKLAPIQKQRVYQQIIEQIRVSLENGELKPGDRLPSERDLAAALNVSRSAVREALSVLEASRLIRVQPGVGVFLESDEKTEMLQKLNDIVNAQPSGVPLAQLLEVRQALESQAAYLAAERASEEDLRNIRKTIDDLREAVEAGRVAAEEDFRFHLAIVEAAHNPMLSEAVKLFSDRCLEGLYVSRSESIRMPGKSAEVLAEHERILRALEQRDAEAARAAMWRHLANVRTRYAIGETGR